jgi:hypothetical protein
VAALAPQIARLICAFHCCSSPVSNRPGIDEACRAFRQGFPNIHNIWLRQSLQSNGR